MNHSETDIALVEKYFDAELSDSEKNNFNARIENDQSFKSLVEQEKALVGAIRHEGLLDNLKYLKGIEATYADQKQVSINRPSKKWYLVAAAAVVGVFIVSRILFTTFSPSPEQLFLAAFTPYPNMFEPTVRSNESTSTPRSRAFQAYEQHDYQQAATLFKQLLASKQEPEILLLLGNANLILGNIDEARNNFTTLSKDYDDLDMQAKWYLSLCYLKSGDVAQARKMLKELGETEISYATKAKELLEKVN